MRWQRPLYENPKRHLECEWKQGDSADASSTTRTEGNAAAYDRSPTLDGVGRSITDFLSEEQTGVCRLPLVGPGIPERRTKRDWGLTRPGPLMDRPSTGMLLMQI